MKTENVSEVEDHDIVEKVRGTEGPGNFVHC